MNSCSPRAPRHRAAAPPAVAAGAATKRRQAVTSLLAPPSDADDATITDLSDCVVVAYWEQAHRTCVAPASLRCTEDTTPGRPGSRRPGNDKLGIEDTSLYIINMCVLYCI